MAMKQLGCECAVMSSTLYCILEFQQFCCQNSDMYNTYILVTFERYVHMEDAIFVDTFEKI